jgi:biopolymer transport protein ExbD
VRKMRSEASVELNLASMLDMAFQLLFFFVLTFKTDKPEPMVLMRLPPMQAVIGAPGGQSAGDREDIDPSKVKAVLTLTLNVVSDNGSIELLQVGVPTKSEMATVQPDSGLKNLEAKLNELIKTSGFEQLIIQYSPKLRWGELMRVVDVCAKQEIKSMNFLPLPEAK